MSILELFDTNDWVDPDVLMFEIGRNLGVFGEGVTSFIQVKSIIWSNNPISDCLYAIVKQLVQIDYLLYDEEEDKYRVNRDFEPRRKGNGKESGLDS